MVCSKIVCVCLCVCACVYVCVCLCVFVCAAPEQWTEIPALVKMYKLLINELSNQIEASLAKQEEEDEDDDDDDDVSLPCCMLHSKSSLLYPNYY